MVNVLPHNLTHLTFGEEFNQPLVIDVLPHNLTHLTFGRNQLDGCRLVDCVMGVIVYGTVLEIVKKPTGHNINYNVLF